MSSLMLVNPRKRRSTRKKRAVTKRKSPARRLSTTRTTTVKRYRRNPSPRMGSAIETVKDGAIGAAGAIATEVVLSKLPLPANLMTGPAKTAVSALGAVGIGMLVGKFGSKALGKKMAQGGVTVALHTIMRSAVAGPVGLAGTDDFMGYYDDGMGYVSPQDVYEDGGMDATFDMDEDF